MSATEIRVPDIGDFSQVDIIEVIVQPGDRIKVDDPLITLESDKASMDIPAPEEGVIREVKVAVGDKVSEGDLIALLESANDASGAAPAGGEAPQAEAPTTPAAGSKAPQEEQGHHAHPEMGAGQATVAPGSEGPAPGVARGPGQGPSFARVHASPSVRRLARERGVDLNQLQGSGPKGRITREDLEQFLRRGPSPEAPAKTAAPPVARVPEGQSGSGIPPIPGVDFAKFGPVETVPLNRIKRLTGQNLSRSWLNVPHVTHHDECDITELEAFRRSLKEEAQEKGVRVTLLGFVMKAVAATLQAFPTFNASLDPSGENLVLKQYIHIGIAVDTPNGLVVPVVRDVDQKSVYELSGDLAALSKKARDKKLGPAEMQGASFTISSLGGIGGTAFTPIVNAPEVAILGLTRSQMKPIWNGKEFVPTLMQPLSLSYDHRVVDGAEAARFVRHLGQILSDIRRLIL